MKEKKNRQEIIDAMLNAVALIEAAFPAGEYGLNSQQNIALNALDDAASQLSAIDDSFRQQMEQAKKKHEGWQLAILLSKGIISKSEFDFALKERNISITKEGEYV